MAVQITIRIIPPGNVSKTSHPMAIIPLLPSCTGCPLITLSISAPTKAMATGEKAAMIIRI
jgi:hypothetical protein